MKDTAIKDEVCTCSSGCGDRKCRLYKTREDAKAERSARAKLREPAKKREVKKS